MSIPKKCSRKIVVNGATYRWRIRWKPFYMQDCQNTNLNAATELYENPQSVLHISFPWIRYNEYFGIAEKSVTPKHIEVQIKNALKHGWKPNENGNFHTVDKTVQI